MMLFTGCAFNGQKDVQAVPDQVAAEDASVASVENIRWELIELNGEAVTASAGRPLPWFRMASDDMRVAGFTGCNRFFGTFKREGKSLTITPMGSTMMACPPDVTIDQAFMKTLEAVVTWKIVDGILEIYNGEGNLLARLRMTGANL
ncbi:MAG: META domain-containing protein [Desulfobacteraceae bacterium]|nr:META domain-containing protein [Desulfobacteraceae bacterium]